MSEIYTIYENDAFIKVLDVYHKYTNRCTYMFAYIHKITQKNDDRSTKCTRKLFVQFGLHVYTYIKKQT